MRRREFMRVTLGAGAVLTAAPSLFRAMEAPAKMTVYKTPACGCCKNWITYMQGMGFNVSAVDVDDLADIKRSSGVPAKLESCHTALVGRYVIEGHVPGDLVKQVLVEHPKIVGLAVPGMPPGAPGMNLRKEPYDVIAWDHDGGTTLYAKR